MVVNGILNQLILVENLTVFMFLMKTISGLHMV
jgi:hypothetical protein